MTDCIYWHEDDDHVRDTSCAWCGRSAFDDPPADLTGKLWSGLPVCDDCIRRGVPE